MSKCMICAKECNGSTCSGACRAKLSRQNARALDQTQSRARALALPGDPEYVGVCGEVDGVWGVKRSGVRRLEPIEQPDLSQLPPNVTRPTGQRTAKTSKMSTQQLSAVVSACSGVSWIDSEEYAEVIYRLLNNTVEDLNKQGQMIPAWKQVLC